MQSIGQVLLDKIRHNFAKYNAPSYQIFLRHYGDSWGGGGLMMYIMYNMYIIILLCTIYILKI